MGKESMAAQLLGQLWDALMSKFRTPTPEEGDDAKQPEGPPAWWEQISGMPGEEYLKRAPDDIRRWLKQIRRPTFYPWEQQAFARMGMNPEMLSAMPAISGFIRGLNAQDQWLENVFKGRSINTPLSDDESELTMSDLTSPAPGSGSPQRGPDMLRGVDMDTYRL